MAGFSIPELNTDIFTLPSVYKEGFKDYQNFRN